MSRFTSLAGVSYAAPIKGLFNTIRNEPEPEFLDTIKPIAEDPKNEISDVMEAAEITLMTAQDRKGIGGDLTDDPLPLNNLVAILKYCEEDTVPPFYAVLNNRSYDKNRALIKPFLQYIWLLMKTLEMLQPYDGTVVNRGVGKDLKKDYPVGKKFLWHGFTSTTKDVGVLPTFLGDSGERTMFQIELTQKQARDISAYSPLAEGEVLLPPSSRFEVKGVLCPSGEMTIIQLVELKSPTWIIDLRPRVTIGIMEITQKFSQFDLDGNGRITRDELETVFSQLGLPNEAVDRLIEMADTDGSGDIDVAEFVAWLCGGSDLAQDVIKAKEEPHELHAVCPEEAASPPSPTSSPVRSKPERRETPVAERRASPAAERRASPEAEIRRASPKAEIQSASPEPVAPEFSAGDFFRVKEAMQSDSKNAVDFGRGSIGHIFQIDKDGDAQVEFDSLDKKEWVLKKNLHKLEKVAAPPVPQSLFISGATGTNGACVNGSYSKSEELFQNHPMWAKVGDTDKWLVRFSSNGMWYVANTNRKTENKAGGWLQSGAGHHAVVTSVKEWKVWDGDSWEIQAIQISEAQNFAAGDWVRINTQTKSDSKDDVDLDQDLVGRIYKIDDDGDATVEFSGLTKREWILKKNFWKFDKVDRPPVPDTLHISGADGSNGAIVNGVYKLTGEEYNSHPAWNKQSDSDKWLLRFPSNGMWYVANANRKAEDKAGGWLQGSSAVYADPRDVTEWKVWNGDSWEVQTITVSEPTALSAGSFFRITQTAKSDSKDSVDLCKGWIGHIFQIDEAGDAQVEFDNLDKKEWILKKNFWNMEMVLPPRVVQSLHISGASGSNGSIVNGVWNLAGQYDNHPCWQKVGDSDKWLARFNSNGMWYVCNTNRKDTSKAGGWLQSISGHHASALNVPEWKIWDGDAWQPQRIEMKEATKFSAGDFFRVKHAMNSDSKNEVALGQGWTGHIWQIDEAGDAQVEFENVGTKEWILKKHFYNMEKMTPPSVPKKLNISGATGSNGSIINGTFNLVGERFNKHPLWNKSDDSDKWILRFANGCWYVANTNRKNTNKTGGWLQSNSGHNVDVTRCSEWKVWNGDSWEEQSIRVCVEH